MLLHSISILKAFWLTAVVAHIGNSESTCRVELKQTHLNL